ncbi:hypothetical protein K491DRAFT_720718 [Lophiostoma macrostomum CBS 122681]|uniref:Uncharacterized protein n=1 Tax=Lophiostoma macrostomum CBS 122681 TaxID=1314788 RepID=A0A6A6SS76_9PLEO|nr:hypothetical protein K491DRAFT_720718 [Lophiostoma macrostomum CBS 122681]
MSTPRLQHEERIRAERRDDDPTQDSHDFDWKFPTQLDTGFVATFVQNFPKNDTTWHPTDLLVGAVRNGTVVEDQSQFGQQYAVVHVGDVVEVDWKDVNTDDDSDDEDRRRRTKRRRYSDRKVGRDEQDRILSLNCVVCSSGIGNGTNGKGVFGACGNYTQSAHMQTLYEATDPQPPNTPYTIPPLNPTIDMPPETVGICFLSIGGGGDWNSSFSAPFPVAQQPRQPHWRFNEDHPTGVEDESIVTSSTATPLASNANAGGRRLSGGAIAGVVLGVLVGVLLLAWLCCWRTRKRPILNAKGGEENANGEAVMGSPQVELQQVQRGGVARRVERDEEGDAPPAYHEIVKLGSAKETQV